MSALLLIGHHANRPSPYFCLESAVVVSWKYFEKLKIAWTDKAYVVSESIFRKVCD